MASDPPSREPTLDQRIRMTNTFHSFLHNASLTMLVVAPVLIAIPPRKLDLYTFALTGAFVASGNHLVKERTGAGLLYQLPGARLPREAVEYQERMGLRNIKVEGGNGSGSGNADRRLLEEGSDRPSIQETMEKHASKQEGTKSEGLSGKAKEIWMGDQPADWKEKRLAEEQKKLDEGEGYGSMIMDQIWDVWNQGEKKAEEIKEKDEEVVAKRKGVSRRDEEFPIIGRKG